MKQWKTTAESDRSTMSDSALAGAPAPDFTLETATGETVRLSDMRGRNVVLFFVREFT